MARDLPATPEGALIRRVRQSARPRLSIPAAAKRAGMSEETWGHLERGYKPGIKGQGPTAFSASDQIVAHAAFALGMAPEDLEQVGRSGAAELLRTMRGPELEVMETAVDDGVVLVTVPPGLLDVDREHVKKVAEDLAAYLDSLRQDRNG